MSHGAPRAAVPVPDGDMCPAEVWMEFSRPELTPGNEPVEPEFTGSGLDSVTNPQNVSSVRTKKSGWLYAGYGAFRHLGNTGARRPGRSRYSKLQQQVSSLFDET